ncbi:unnamed protein product [Angiostrongylus costaricensis]|uniref:Uncharacterized protein n=1 Tax=Angiostrongylus costaricensis TaxID=334426 RepID=A0A0R3Q1S7_ANGCS|nr:unnamed protein product [Angiostrongylus costaricensis]
MSNVPQEDDRFGGQSSSRRALKKDMMIDESLERAEPTGLLLHAAERDGKFTGARSSHSTINGTTGVTADDTSEWQRRYHCLQLKSLACDSIQ